MLSCSNRVLAVLWQQGSAPVLSCSCSNRVLSCGNRVHSDPVLSCRNTRQSSLSYFPLFSSPAHPHCTQLDPRSRLTFQRGIWHQWKLGLLCYYLCLQILQHFMAVSIACLGKDRIFDCMNVGVFISPVSSFLKPLIHFRDSVL